MTGYLMVDAEQQALRERCGHCLEPVTCVVSVVIQADRRPAPALGSVQPGVQPNTLRRGIRQCAVIRESRVLQAGIVYPADFEERTEPDIRRRHCRRRLATGEDRRSAEL